MAVNPFAEDADGEWRRLAHKVEAGAEFLVTPPVLDLPAFEAEVPRLKGELVLAQNASDAAEAEQCFRTAIEIAQQRSFKWWELRATTGLARLLRDTNRHDEARAMLAEIYNWFTEGFDTTDLKEAKALLDELKS